MANPYPTSCTKVVADPPQFLEDSSDYLFVHCSEWNGGESFVAYSRLNMLLANAAFPNILGAIAVFVGGGSSLSRWFRKRKGRSRVLCFPTKENENRETPVQELIRRIAERQRHGRRGRANRRLAAAPRARARGSRAGALRCGGLDIRLPEPVS